MQRARRAAAQYTEKGFDCGVFKLRPDSEKYICCDCVGDNYLKTVIQDSQETEACSYCGSDDQPCIGLAELAENVERAFNEHFCRTANEPDGLQSIMMNDRESTYEWEREGESVIAIIQDEAGVEEELAEDIRVYLDSGRSFDEYGEESEFDDEVRYEKLQQDGSHWHEMWQRLENELKTQSRFFNQTALELFQAVFHDISKHETKNGRPILRKLRPGVELYRARVFQDDEKLQEALKSPAKLLGPPLTNATAGRMNAHGISVFYGSTKPDVAMAEVRPPVGSKVVISKFILQVEVQLLDLTALKFVAVTGSVFDPSYLGKIERAEFLKTFCNKITQPVMPSFETSEYLITQATADYLASETELNLDGIIYPSAQISDDSPVNLVLFHKSSKAPESDDTVFDVSLTANDEGEDYYDYSIRPAHNATKPSSSSESFFDDRQQVLLLDEMSLLVAHVKGVTFSTDDYPVRR